MQVTIHGHEVLNLIYEADAPVDRALLEQTVAERYGTEARFHTCSASQMTLPELITFLESRGKIRILGGRLAPGSSPSCSHAE